MEIDLHYYQFNIGDYIKHTLHLTPDEDLAYRRLLDIYYDTEQPLQKDFAVVARRIRMPVDVTERVVREFFDDSEDGWRNFRADQEIAKYHEFIEKQKANGSLGGRPKKTHGFPNANPEETQEEPKKSLNTNQEPITNNQVITLPKGRESEARLPPCPHQQVIDLFHELLPELPKVIVWNKTREGLLRARWKEVAVEKKWNSQEEGIEHFRELFGFVRKSKFLMGKTAVNGRRPFECELEWLLRPNNWVKVIEGKYHGS
jgi:uncharacterized protein YdaU (DUF1376 family)